MRLVVTNNPQVKTYLSGKKLDSYYDLIWIEGYTEDVLRNVRNLCHNNYRLLTHPLSGSIKPNHTPYKTVILEKSALPVIELESIALAESGLAKTLALLADKPRLRTDPHCLDDFAVIDLDFFKSYLLSTANYPGYTSIL